jgi:hypothetical protein
VVKVAAGITSDLARYWQVLTNDPELAKLVQFRVVKKGENERARVAKVLQSNVCEDTVSLLRDNHQRWMQDPSVFWKGPSPSATDSPDPQVQIVGRLLQTDPNDP